METTVSVIIILFYSMLVLVPSIGLLHLFCPVIADSFFGDTSLGHKIVGIVLISSLCGLFAFSSFKIIYLVANKYFGNPKPSNQIEMYLEGEKIIQYQDTTHLCDANDENSHCFTARIPANKKAYRDDICIHCGQPFTNHYTHKEKRFFDAMSSIKWEWSISY